MISKTGKEQIQKILETCRQDKDITNAQARGMFMVIANALATLVGDGRPAQNSPANRSEPFQNWAIFN